MLSPRKGENKGFWAVSLLIGRSIVPLVPGARERGKGSGLVMTHPSGERRCRLRLFNVQGFNVRLEGNFETKTSDAARDIYRTLFKSFKPYGFTGRMPGFAE